MSAESDLIGKVLPYKKSSSGFVKVLAYDQDGMRRGGEGRRWMFRLVEWDNANSRAVGGPECDHYCTSLEDLLNG